MSEIPINRHLRHSAWINESHTIISIGNDAFYDCSGLTSITIPSSVTSIGSDVFYGRNEELTIYGKADSYAETYAKSCKIKFSTGEMPKPGEKKTLSDNSVTLNQDSYVYDGQPKKPSVTVKDGNTVLKENTDYTVDYQNNINVGTGTAKVIVTGQGNYTGTVTKTFTITEQKKTDPQPEPTPKPETKPETEPKPETKPNPQPVKKTLSADSIILSQTSYTYDGKAKKPTVTVKDGNKVLKKDTDYTVAYQNNINVGTAKVIVTGQGNYNGSVTKTFTIIEQKKPGSQPAKKKILSGKSVTLSKTSYAYDGRAKKPAVTVKDGKTVLKAGKDYTVSYQNNKNAGKAKVIVKGKGNYSGTVTKTFTITVKKNTSHKVGSYQYKVTGSSAVSVTKIKNSKVTKVKIPKTVKIGGKNFKVTAVGSNAFKKNKKITTVEIGDNVKIIGAGAFEGCTKLNKVTVGKGVTEIGKNTFKDCKKLKDITVKSTKLKKVGKNALKGIKSNARIKVPSKKLSEYRKLFKNKGQGKKVKVVK